MPENTSSAPHDAVKIGIVSISDRASSGVYEDKGLPALKDWLTRALKNPVTFEARLIPDVQATISQALIELVDANCALVLTTGGTGPALRDVTPEATLAVAHKEMPGFGEQMRQISLSLCPPPSCRAKSPWSAARASSSTCPGSPSRSRKRLKACVTQRVNPSSQGFLRPCPTAWT